MSSTSICFIILFSDKINVTNNFLFHSTYLSIPSSLSKTEKNENVNNCKMVIECLHDYLYLRLFWKTEYNPQVQLFFNGIHQFLFPSFICRIIFCRHNLHDMKGNNLNLNKKICNALQRISSHAGKLKCWWSVREEFF